MNWSFKYISLYFFRTIELNKLIECSKDYIFQDPILDLGCGDGTFTKEFFGEGKDIVGIDNSTRELKKNQCFHTYVDLKKMDACNMSFENGTFNTVFSNCVIEHIPDLEKLLDEVYRVLKPGGYFIFTVPSDRFKDFLLFSISGWYQNARNKRLNHFHCHNHKWWDNFLLRKGLLIKNHEYYLPKEALVFWDFLALSTFHFWWLAFPFAKILYRRAEEGIKKYSQEKCFSGGAVAIIAKKCS